ncbi:MAG TPA: DsbA family protein [Tepidisphaeraceae bacterium]|jgi:protein-disulfide isomerase|nr:DsbA family protein [Tepidisphaeraceae bacterium]
MSEQKSDDILHLPVSEYDHIRGQADAPLTLLEYGDYECPDCEHAAPIVDRLRKEFGDRLRFVFRHFPNSAIHTHASEAAQAAEAAGAQGKFWEMHDVLYKHQKDLADHDITHFGLLVGAEIYRFQSDLSSSRFAARVAQDYDSGLKNGVNGTPTFFINGQRYRGPATFDALREALENAK